MTTRSVHFKMNKIICFVLIFYLKGVMLDSCGIHRTCRDCIRDPSVCDWCASDKHSEDRCKPKSFTTSNPNWCKDEFEQPRGSQLKTKDDPISSKSGNVTQIKPQGYQLNLRPGEPQEFNFSFSPSQNYPIDIYFLFDASQTMEQHRNNTAKQSKNIYETMHNLTQDVYMGMGTFVDKNMLPFTINVAAKSSYSFQHHLNLTHNYEELQNAIENIKVGQNRDMPEAGLDALAQAIVCKKVIGWRNESRKILILMTDESYHAAGDGRSGGLFTPYDGECHTKGNVYTKELEMDYPSVPMINKLVRENDVIVVFAVSLTDVYSRLVDVVSGSKMIVLNTDMIDTSNSFVKKLKEIYEEISTKIKLNVNMHTDASGSAHRKNFEILFEPDCTKDLDACNVIGVEPKKFTGIIKVLEYEGYDKAAINISIEGIAEKLILDINIVNTCKCEKDAKESPICQGDKRECGVCLCEEPKFGDKCQCNTTNIITTTCKSPTMKQDCNGHGKCNCGTCDCSKGYVGPYCECFVTNCPISNNQPCGDHGKCQCDETCKCDINWTGNACQCNQMLCMAPIVNMQCNGRGKCDCDSCKCDEKAKWDMRITENQHCVLQSCADCHEPQCNLLTDCAICLMKDKDTKDCNCTIFGNDLIHEVLDKLPDNITHSDNNEDWHVCTKVRSDTGCYTNFTYKYVNHPYKIRLQLQRKQNCAEIQYIFGAVFLICVLLIGVLTLLAWKLITYFHDRQEYLQFMKDHVPDAAPCQNPLYEPATTEFRNPAFGKSTKN